VHQQPGKTWWGRNWKWFLPVGCLGALVLFAGFIASIMFVTFGVMKSSDAYKDAVAKARAHPAVQESIGTPIEEGLVVTGNIHVSGSSGNADLSIPLSGPKGDATLFVQAQKSAGQWIYSTLVVEIRATKQRIDLLE
jgi:hypothetical protein